VAPSRTVATDSNLPGNLSFTGIYGSFSLGNTGAVGSPAEVQPNLSTSVLVSSNSTGRILFVYMTEQGLTSPQGAHQFVSRFEISLISGAISPISLRTLVSSSNELYSGSVLAPLTTFSNVGAGSSTNTTPDLSGPFLNQSLEPCALVTHRVAMFWPRAETSVMAGV
jgi:hypothetical protein